MITCFDLCALTCALVQVRSKLGPDRTPHLCQLFVTADSYASRNIRFGGAVSTMHHPSALRIPSLSPSGVHLKLCF